MLSTQLTKSILHTTENYIKALGKAGISTVEDLLLHLPRDYEDRTNVLDSFSLINVKEKNTVLVTLVSIHNQKTANGKVLTKSVFEDNNGFLSEAVWFNRKYLATQLQEREGKKIIISGKVKYAFGKITFQSPEVETNLSKMGGEIVPIYPELNYIPSKWIHSKMELLAKYIPAFQDTLPDNIITKYNFISRKQAIYKIHFPKNKNDIQVAKSRLAYEELFDINYKSIAHKYETFRESQGKSLAIALDSEYVKEILSHLPFPLTDHQKIALFQILKDMEKSHSMQRLLEGDVGTGKTVVALVSSIHAIKRSEHISAQRDQESLPQQQGTSPQPSPLGGEGAGISSQYSCLEEGKYSIRKLELKSPSYVFDLAKEFRKNPTESEKKVWELLKNKNFDGIKFRRQHPIGRYIADFYSEELRLIIELDGKIHDSKIQKEYDLERENLLKSYGFSIIRLSNDEVINNSDNYIFEKITSFSFSSQKGVLGLSTCSLSSKGEGWGEVPGSRGLGGGPGLDNGEATTKSIQVAIMAPTEILARQHFSGMQDILLSFGLKSHLLVGSTTAKQKGIVKNDIKTGNVDIVVGTHALVQDDVIFSNLGLVVIDEQHRFGVKQREVLEKGFGNLSGLIPHSLNMTATPIPRTLALTLYGDQDLSIISEYPKGRKEIFTKVAKNDTHRSEIELFIRSELEKTRQVFWISPLVEESEKIDLANAIETYESLVEIFAPFQVGLLHGKMKPKEKEQIMNDFKENKIQVLSSTSVVEVGVDVPNATIMCIEGAERFGLSQLHQFRGRVGRGQHQSYCYLFPSKGNYTDRLKAMERTNNGFELAEVDLELRGPGEVYGLRQSGVPDLKVASLTDLEFISQIRQDIEEMFEK